MLSFQHAGDAGDIVYSLPVVRYMGGGDFYLQPANYTRVKMVPERVDLFKRLLESQPYINEVKFHYGRSTSVDLNFFRSRMTEHLWDETLVEMHCRAFDVPESELDKPWISVEPRIEAKVIINLTPRYRNKSFPWSDVYEEYCNDAAFVGSKDEHAQFVAYYGPIPHCDTKDLMDVARVIRGSKLFIGNQSCPLAIAHAMHHPTLCEYSRNACNGMVRKINCTGTAGANIELPII